MKKTKAARKSLLLSTEKVRRLNDETLTGIVGGQACDPTEHGVVHPPPNP